MKNRFQVPGSRFQGFRKCWNLEPGTRNLGALAALIFLAGCILVDDFGGAWDRAVADPCTSKLAEAIYYGEFRRDPDGKDMDKLAHVLTLGDYRFLLLKKSASDRGGRMYRFRIINGIFQRYRLDPSMRETFVHDYPDAPVDLSRDTATLKQLDPQTEKLLLEISSRPEYWQIEDQALYNVLRNPACRYDDRPPEPAPPPQKPAAKK